VLHKYLLLSLHCLLLAAMCAFGKSPDVIDAVNEIGRAIQMLNADEQTLNAVGLGTDDASLIEFFRSKTLKDIDRDVIVALIRDLGANEFKAREKASSELVKIGGKAISLLRQAKDSLDLEVARRAEDCLGRIVQRQRPAVMIAAARLLAARRPTGTAQTLLNFAPYADDRDVLDSIRDTLTAVAVRDGKPDPILTEALRSRKPLWRGLAAEALVRAGQAENVPVVRDLLDDADRLVRLRVGLAFVDKGNKAAIPRLIDLLGDLPRDQSQPIVDLLEQIALDKSPQVPLGDDESMRVKRRDAWSQWWTNNGEGIDLAKIPRKLLVLMETSQGTIRIELFPDKAPLTVKNFLQYVQDGHYEGLLFHRVISTFMIQGGGMEAGMKERKARDPIKNESSNNLSNKRGTIAMARLAKPDSATSQFFINVKDNEFLDKAKAPDQVGYCVFGRVIGGMDVVDRIKDEKTGTVGGHQDVPLEDVVIKSVRIVK
jgi:cyclophilin family peptidyl-prolyl cis-trans isomerase